MSLPLDGPASARIAASVRSVCWLVALDFTSGTIRYTTWPIDLVIGGNTYTGLGQLADVAAVAESENTAADQLTLGFSLTSTALLAATLGNVDDYRGRSARLWLQLLDDVFQPAGAPVQRWAGSMDKVRVSRSRSPATGGPSSGRLELLCSRAGMARARTGDGLRLNHLQQQARYPGDTGLRYVQQLVEQPALWLSKRFQQL